MAIEKIILDRHSFLERTKWPMPQAEVEVPELGEGATVTVRGLTAAEQSDYDRLVYKHKMDEAGKLTFEYDNELLNARLVTFGTIDPATGAKLFNPDDASSLGQAHNAAITRIADKIAELSGFNRNTKEKIEKN